MHDFKDLCLAVKMNAQQADVICLENAPTIVQS